MIGVELTVNGTARSTAPDTTVEELMEQLGIDTDARGVAVAVNGVVVPKSAWADTRLADGDSVEVIHAVQGG